MSDEQFLWRPLAEMLAAVRSGAKFEDQDKRLAVLAIAYNLIQSEEVKKPCKCCGAPRHDYSYFKITGAGRLLIAALESTPHQHGAGNGEKHGG